MASPPHEAAEDGEEQDEEGDADGDADEEAGALAHCARRLERGAELKRPMEWRLERTGTTGHRPGSQAASAQRGRAGEEAAVWLCES